MSAAAPSSRRRFSPLAYWNAVPAAQVQAVLRQVFRRWGRPRRLRLDNGVPWGAMVDLPSELTLWLLGLDMGITFNPPRRPKTTASSNVRKAQASVGPNRGRVPTPLNCNAASRTWT
jgi:hypothetical protein